MLCEADPSVSGITPDSVVITVKGPDKTTSTEVLPSGLTLWSTGIGEISSDVPS